MNYKNYEMRIADLEDELDVAEKENEKMRKALKNISVGKVGDALDCDYCDHFNDCQPNDWKCLANYAGNVLDGRVTPKPRNNRW